jgi:hypothetical protein
MTVRPRPLDTKSNSGCRSQVRRFPKFRVAVVTTATTTTESHEDLPCHNPRILTTLVKKSAAGEYQAAL